MSSTTPILGLKTFNTTTDASSLVNTYINDVSGSVIGSNLDLLDNFANNVIGGSYISGSAGINVSGSKISLTTTGVISGSYNTIEVDSYGRITSGSIVTSGSASIPETTAENDFQVGSGSGTWEKKTLAETKTILGVNVVTASPSSDHEASGVIITLIANENQAFGDVCYIDSSGEAHLADADAIATAGVVCMCADASISAGATGDYLLLGIARDDTWAWTVGGKIYLSTTGTTGNTMTQTAPSGANDVIQIIGIATHADRMYFNPSLSMVEHV